MPNPSSEQAPATRSMSVDGLACRFSHKVFRQGGRSIKNDTVTKQAKVPWESWELGEQFFRTLSQWTLANPETTLDRILDSVREGLENSKDLFSLIPENPFPARGLVTALAHLIKLSISVRRARRGVYEFAKDLVQWVGLVKSAFERTQGGEFAYRVWRDLKHMRNLVENMCLWAVERLTDGRWLRIGHGLMVHKEIQEFNERIVNARLLFQDLSAINISRGLDTVSLKLRNLFRNQRFIIEEIKETRKIQQEQSGRIANEFEMQKEVTERERFFVKTLNVHAIASPAYDSQGKRTCDEDTRVEVLENIRNWRDDIRCGFPNFLWLTGDPGSGKSTVTASFTRECKNEGVLWAQFFINRNNAETTNPRSYFPSIARQLADYSPEVAQSIHHALVKQRSLTDNISAEQAAHLFVDSVRVASQLDPDRPVVVVVDGLDETSRDQLEDTAIIFSTLFTALETYGNVKVLISSRTENEIQKYFGLPLQRKYIKRIHLDTAHPTSLRDVSHYIERNLLDLVRKNDLNWEVWPGDENSRLLGERASGLFIWAVTAIKFIQEELHSHGEECLDKVINMLTAEVLHDINALYTLILAVTLGHREDEWEFERFRRIVGAIVCLQEPLCIDDLTGLLELRKEPLRKLVDVVHFVRRFRTILVNGTDPIDGTTIPRVHKSVYEFITSNSVNTQFRVHTKDAHLELAMQCLVHLGAVRESVSGGGDALPILIRYTCRFWSSHLWRADIGSSPALCANYSKPPLKMLVPTFLPIRIQYSAPTSRIKTRLTVPHLISTSLADMRLQGGPVIWDATTGLSISLTSIVLGVASSPNGKDIVSWSDDRTIEVWDSTNAKYRRTLTRQSSICTTLAISPDGMSVVTGSRNGMIYCWDYLTGAPIWKSSQGDDNVIRCVAISPDGKQIISGCQDGTCRLLNTGTGQMVGQPWISHESQTITSVGFSCSGRIVCSTQSAGYDTVWDISTGEVIYSCKYSAFQQFSGSSFSPSDDKLIAMSGTNGLEIRSGSRDWSISEFQGGHCLSFSPDGKEIIFVSAGNAISVAEIGNDERPTHITRKGYLSLPEAHIVGFSPRWDFAYCAQGNTIHAYTLEHGETDICACRVPKESHAIDKAGYEELIDAVLNMERAKSNPKTVINNRRLDAIEWYELADVVKTDVKLCMVTDKAIIAGYDDGSLSIWELEN